MFGRGCNSWRGPLNKPSRSRWQIRTPMTSIPATMTAIGITSAGGHETLVPQERPVPQPGAGEILVKVIAAGVNRPDVAQRMGGHPPPPGVTDIPALEGAGVVAASRPDVPRAHGR